jgi:glycosyltransferase involved in cell wall biosynthesis
LKVAIVHYWLIKMRGGEKVVEALCEIFPEADIFTHVYDPSAISDTINQHRVFTTFIQKLPQAKKLYQRYLPLMPIALEQLDLRSYDLVISSESGPAKGVLTRSNALHICYCHTPMRYIWDMYHDYRQGAGWVTQGLMPLLVHYLRLWDQLSSNRVDFFIANSNYVARRIQKHYRRSATVIYPPVETEKFTPSSIQGDFYLMVGQLVPYKRFDLAIAAFNQLNKPLIVIGYGPELKALKAKANSNIQFLGHQNFEVIQTHYAQCQALIFPGEEDFGIVPIEAMASGRPIIAFGRGGALETILEGKTGVFFQEQTPESLIQAVENFESIQDRFVAEAIAHHAQQFNRTQFVEKMQTYLESFLQDDRGCL